MRFWMSFWCGDVDWLPEGEGAPPWVCTSERDREPHWSVCALVDAANEDAAWTLVQQFWPYAEERFCFPHELDWLPSHERFRAIHEQLDAR